MCVFKRKIKEGLTENLMFENSHKEGRELRRHLGEEHSAGREEPVQRSCGGSLPSVCKEQ